MWVDELHTFCSHEKYKINVKIFLATYCFLFYPQADCDEFDP